MIRFLFWLPVTTIRTRDALVYLAACYSNWGREQVIELGDDCYVRFF